MTDEHGVSEEGSRIEHVRLKRHKPRRKSRRPVSEKPGYIPKPKQSNLALTEIDSRLAQAIRDRSEAMARVSELVHWQDRLARLEQEINSLIGFQQRLLGRETPGLVFTPPVLPSSVPVTFPGHLAGNLDGVTSIPAGKGPKPTTPNVADIVGGEGGFS